jgi:signal transduction histidine kinase
MLVGKEIVNLVELLEELKAEATIGDEKAGLHIQWRIADDLLVGRTDRTKLKTVVRNLLSNAVKFTKEGSVTVEARPRDDGVEISVTDTGIGIAPEIRPVIFDLFQQGDSSATRYHGGVGLGLYIVQRMLELLGGTIEVESEVGKGSTFRVWVPVE